MSVTRNELAEFMDAVVDQACQLDWEFTGRDLADAIWLASRWPLDEIFPPLGKSPPLPAPGPPDQATPAELGPETPEPGGDKPPQPKPASPAPEKMEIRPAASPGGAGGPGEPIRTPAPPPLQEPLRYLRAMMPIARRGPSRTETEIDIEATVELACNEDIFEPVMIPVKERVLNVSLVLDVGPSMPPWASLLRDLDKLLTGSRAFRRVNSWCLDTTDSPRLFRLNPDGSEAKYEPLECPGPHAQHLIVVCTDCVSPAWNRKTTHELLQAWTEEGTVVVGQVLPPQLWDRTALRWSDEQELMSTVWLPANQRMQCRAIERCDDLSLWEEDQETPAQEQDKASPSEQENKQSKKKPPGPAPLPVFHIEPQGINDLCLWLAGKASSRMAGYVPRERGPGVPDDAPQDAAAAVREFRMHATQDAIDLAILLAAAPAISLPISRLIEETMLRRASNRLAEAELWLSRMLEVIAGGQHEDPEQTLFRFREGVRAALRRDLPQVTGYDVLQNVSAYVERNLGRLGGFQALLTTPGAAGPAVSMAGPIAEVAVETLEWLGGDFARAVRRAQAAVKTPSKIAAKPLDHPQDPPRPIHTITTDQEWPGEAREIMHRFAWSIDGEFLAIPTRGGRVGTWPLHEDADLGLEWQQVSRAGVNQVEWLPAGTGLAAACFTKSVKLLRAGDQLAGNRLAGHKSDVTCVALSTSEPEFLASGTAGGTLRVWDPRRQTCLALHWFAAGSVRAICWLTPERLAVGTAANLFLVRFARDENDEWRLQLEAELPLPVASLACSPSAVHFGQETGALAIVGTSDGQVRFVNLQGQELFQLYIGREVFQLEFGQEPITGLDVAQNWDAKIAYPGELLAVKTPTTAAIVSLVDGQVFWEANTGARSSSPYGSIAFNPQYPLIAVSSDEDRAIHVYELPTAAAADKPGTSLRIRVLGSLRDNAEQSEEFVAACWQIGQEIARRGHCLVISSASEKTADLFVCRGYAQAEVGGRVILARSNDEKVERYRADLNLPENIELEEHLSDEAADRTNASHREAFAHADALIVIGGRSNTLRGYEIARRIPLPVVADSQFGGIGRDVWRESLDALRARDIDVSQLDDGSAPLFGQDYVSKMIDVLEAACAAREPQRENDADPLQQLDPSVEPWNAVCRLTLIIEGMDVQHVTGVFFDERGVLFAPPVAPPGSRVASWKSAVREVRVFVGGASEPQVLTSFKIVEFGEPADIACVVFEKLENPATLDLFAISDAEAIGLPVEAVRFGFDQAWNWSSEPGSSVVSQACEITAVAGAQLAIETAKDVGLGSLIVCRRRDNRRLRYGIVGVVSGPHELAVTRITQELIEEFRDALMREAKQSPGADTWVQVKDADQYPFRAICSLRIRKSGRTIESTGFLVARNLVMTAGHNLFNHSQLGPGFVDEVEVLVGGSVTRKARGQEVVSDPSQFVVSRAWQKGVDLHDWGVVRIQTNFQEEYGSFGVAALSDEELREQSFQIVAHRHDGGEVTLWANTCRFDHLAVYTLRWPRISPPGQSGSPLFAWDGKDSVAVGMQTATTPDYSEGLRFTPDVIETILKLAEETPTERSQSGSASKSPGSSKLKYWQQRLDELMGEAEFTGLKPGSGLSKKIQEAQAQIARLSSGDSKTNDPQVESPADRLSRDLETSRQRGKLQGSQLADLVLECLRAVGPLKLSEDYHAASLEATIRRADDLVRQADFLAGKLEGRESAIQSVRLVVVGLVKAAVPSRRLQKLVILVAEKILGLPEVDLFVDWPAHGQDEFYNILKWGKDVDIDNLLDTYCRR